MPAFMDAQARRALDFFAEWRAFTEESLKIAAPNCPIEPNPRKTRPWQHPGGPVGMILHYTGGPDGIASMRWSNENPLNRGSSWHCTVLDKRLQLLDQVYKKYPLVVANLPVTAFLHANIHRGTWHGNWTNSRTFGLENRNLGILRSKDGVHGYVLRTNKGRPIFKPLPDQKRAVLVNQRWAESFTKEQLIANINIGRQLRAWRGCDFDPAWVLPHSAVWISKFDVGPAFPIHAVRASIFSSIPVEHLPWLRHYENALPSSREERQSSTDTAISDDRNELVSLNSTYAPVQPEDFDSKVGTGWRERLSEVRSALHLLGYHVHEYGYESLEDVTDAKQSVLDADLRQATFIFQMSTNHPKYSNPLKVDGIPGDKTWTVIQARLKDFGYK